MDWQERINPFRGQTMEDVQDFATTWGAAAAGAALVTTAGIVRKPLAAAILMAAAGGTLLYYGLSRGLPFENRGRWRSKRQIRSFEAGGSRQSNMEGDDVGHAPESGEPAEGSTTGRDTSVAPDAGDHIERAPEAGGRVRVTGSQEDVVGEGSDESFPASDPPSWTPGRA